jgi:hypothetical protein
LGWDRGELGRSKQRPYLDDTKFEGGSCPSTLHSAHYEFNGKGKGN